MTISVISVISVMFGPEDLPALPHYLWLGRILTVPHAGDPNPGARKNQKEKPLLGSSLIVISKDDVH